MTVPEWPPRDWRAIIALLATIAGAAVLTFFAWRLVGMLDDYAQRLISAVVDNRPLGEEAAGVLITIIRTLAWGLKLLLGGVIVVLLTLGLAINRRTLKLSKSGFEASGGDEEGLPFRGEVQGTIEPETKP